MGERSETFRSFRNDMQMKKMDNLRKSTNILTASGIRFDSRNEGLHLIIRTDTGKIVNFFPSTGLYNGFIQGRGVFNLLRDLKNRNSEDAAHSLRQSVDTPDKSSHPVIDGPEGAISGP